MSIRLQDALTKIAEWNGIDVGDGWPLLKEYLEWFLISCGGMRLDSSCGLFWGLESSVSSHGFHGLNSAALTDRLMTAIYGDFLGIHGIFNRIAFVLERLGTIVLDQRSRDLLIDVQTTADFAARFAFDRELAFPDELFIRQGRHGDRIYKDWCCSLLDRIITQGSHCPREGGMTAAARHIHALLGGRLDQESIRRAIGPSYRELLGKRRKPAANTLKS